MIGFINGSKIYLNNNMPVLYGSSGEDLDNLKSNQIKIYSVSNAEVANAPKNMIEAWFNVEVLVQNNNNGTMILYTDQDQIFFRSLTNGKWHSWHEIAFK